MKARYIRIDGTKATLLTHKEALEQVEALKAQGARIMYEDDPAIYYWAIGLSLPNFETVQFRELAENEDIEA